MYHRTRPSTSCKLITWLTILSVYYSSIGLWDFMPQAGAQEPEAVIEAVRLNDPTPVQTAEGDDTEPIVPPFEASAPMLLAQAQVPAVTLDASAQAMLDQAQADSDAGRHVDAAIAVFEVADNFPNSPESVEAIRFLTRYQERMLDGEFPQVLINMFEQLLPSYEACRTAESKYLLLGYWFAASKFARAQGDRLNEEAYARKLYEHCQRMSTDHPNHPVMIYVYSYLNSAARMLSSTEQHLARVHLENVASAAKPTTQTCAARAILAKSYRMDGRVTDAASQRRALIGDWLKVRGDAVLAGTSLPEEVRALYAFHLGLAHQDKGDYSEAYRYFDLATTLPLGGEARERSAIQRALLVDRMNPSDSNAAIRAYQSFLGSFPDSMFSGDALLNMASVYLREQYFDYAYTLYEEVIRKHPGTTFATTAQENTQFLMQRELAVAHAGEGSLSNFVLARACGPVALQYLLAHVGVAAELPVLLNLAKTDSRGSSMENRNGPHCLDT